MAHFRRSFVALAALALVASTAQATTFVVDASQSQLTIANGLFHNPGRTFVSILGPAPGTDFTRAVGGTVEADPVTGILASGSLQLQGLPLQADQLISSPRGGPVRDIGDFVLSGLAISFDSLGNAALVGGLMEYDLTTGSTRIRSTAPRPLPAEGASFANLAAPPSLSNVGGVLQLTIPVVVEIVDLHVTNNGETSFLLFGELVSRVPEPGTGTLVSLGLVMLATPRRRTAPSRRGGKCPGRAGWLESLLCLLVIPLAGCPALDDDDEEDPLPPVMAVDDSASTQQGIPVRIRVLENDLQDDDFVDAFTDAIDASGAVQPGSVDNAFPFIFPDGLDYTPPPGFTGVVTIEYDIVGLGIDYNHESADTGTVTVTVTPGLPPVDAVDDMAITDVDVPVVVDVLLNDSQDADLIDSFSDAVDSGGTVQPGSVALLTGGVEMLEYTPPAGFEGSVDFDYTIVGSGVGFDASSMDTAVVTVDVVQPGGQARVQFKDDSTTLPFIEIGLFYLGQQAIDDDIATAEIFVLGAATACVPFPSGTDVPVRARFLENTETVVDSVCPQLLPATDYTIRLVDGLDLVCDEGVIADPVACGP